MAEAPKRKGGIRKRVPVDVDDEEDEAAAALLRCSSIVLVLDFSMAVYASMHCRKLGVYGQ